MKPKEKRKSGLNILDVLVGAPAALLLGLVGRIWFFFLEDSFWRDETKLLLNVCTKSFGELTGPLLYGQEASIPFLWLYRGLFSLGATSELSIRALSLVATLLSLCLFYRLAQRTFSSNAAFLLSVWLMALSPAIILFAGIAKPYAVDILVATVLLYAFIPWCLNPQGHLRIWRLATLAGVAPWLSLPSIFINAGVGGSLFLKRSSIGLRPFVIFGGAITFSFLLESWLFFNRYLYVRKFVEFFYFTYDDLLRIFGNIFYFAWGPDFLLANYLKNPYLLGLTALVGFGIWEAKKIGWHLVTVLTLPLLLALAAIVARMYPIFGRSLLFASPGLMLLLGYGISFLSRAYLTLWSLLLVSFLILSPSLASFAVMNSGPVKGVREALQFVAARQNPGDIVFCDSYAAPTVLYYVITKRPYALSLNYGHDLESQIEGRVSPLELKASHILQKVPLDQRVWLVAETIEYQRVSHPVVLPYCHDVICSLNSSRKRVMEFTNGRVKVVCFDKMRGSLK
jgi:hypothetical protein